jgi:hypothetical protein
VLLGKFGISSDVPSATLLMVPDDKANNEPSGENTKQFELSLLKAWIKDPSFTFQTLVSPALVAEAIRLPSALRLRQFIS